MWLYGHHADVVFDRCMRVYSFHFPLLYVVDILHILYVVEFFVLHIVECSVLHVVECFVLYVVECFVVQF